jgi:hypothetical protein
MQLNTKRRMAISALFFLSGIAFPVGHPEYRYKNKVD